jgi:signal transduction histidine kinase
MVKKAAVISRLREKMAVDDVLSSGTEPFTIASRIVREFGERLVKHPEVAVLELVKNSYDADATRCTVEHSYPSRISISDDGHGMTLEEFLAGWMRIGTSAKNLHAESRRFERKVSGEKGIGRFAVSYLGRFLTLTTVADDPLRKCRTILTAHFDWPAFDRNADLGTIKVPYELRRAAPKMAIGTTLVATDLRPSTEYIDFRSVQTASLGLLSPYQALLRKLKDDEQLDLPDAPASDQADSDPGFDLIINTQGDDGQRDVAADILKNFVFRCVVGVDRNRLKLRLYRRGEARPFIKVDDRYTSEAGRVYADLRFFPGRKGTFSEMPVDGRLARTWVKEHAGVAVFDRNFRVLPYGTQGDDWLSLAADNVRNERNPKSSVAMRHFPMDPETRQSTQLNYMLRLPYPYQLVGAVQVYGRRSNEQGLHDAGLVVTADRQGFVDNDAFRSLVDVVRSAAEVIAYADREQQQEELRRHVEELAATAQQETQAAITQIRSNANLNASEKKELVQRLVAAQTAASQHEDLSRGREAALEVMSLLGVVAGFMTHEFGTAINHLEQSHAILSRHAKKHPDIAREAATISKHITVLRDFVAYSQGYVRGTSIVPEKPVPAKPRIQQVIRVFGKYAADRKIDIEVDVGSDVMAPKVPLSLYSGIVLNLYTNALKAVTAGKAGGHNEIAIRAWSDGKHHRLQVSDTGIGIPSALGEKVFDPLFSTTDHAKDPLGSGMGLGLTLVRRGARAFGGSVQLVKPPPGYTTCFEVRFPQKDTE